MLSTFVQILKKIMKSVLNFWNRVVRMLSRQRRKNQKVPALKNGQRHWPESWPSIAVTRKSAYSSDMNSKLIWIRHWSWMAALTTQSCITCAADSSFRCCSIFSLQFLISGSQPWNYRTHAGSYLFRHCSLCDLSGCNEWFLAVDTYQLNLFLDFMKSEELTPGELENTLFIAKTCHAMGDNEKAVTYLKKASRSTYLLISCLGDL